MRLLIIVLRNGLFKANQIIVGNPNGSLRQQWALRPFNSSATLGREDFDLRSFPSRSPTETKRQGGWAEREGPNEELGFQEESLRQGSMTLLVTPPETVYMHGSNRKG